MNNVESRAEELRLEGMARVRANELEAALPLFDQALELADSDELRELITINKAGALIWMEKSGPEVQALPRIIMRRRTTRHLYLAAYNLCYRHMLARENERATFYGRVALEAAEAGAGAASVANVRVLLGNIATFDSRNAEAMEHYEAALAITSADDVTAMTRAFALQNLGYCYLLDERSEEGVELIHQAIDAMTACGAEGHVAESFIDLCHGYLDLDRLEDARTWGELGLAHATETRQIRNAHYLLGEVNYKLGDIAAAETHFNELATHYPDFPHLKNLLFAIDLRSMVNFKL